MRTGIFSTLRGSAWAISIATALGAAAGVTGCFLNEKEEVGGTADEVNAGAEVSLLLKSTLILDAGCVATKVGPRHLLLSARCVKEHKEAFAKGKELPFKTANNARAGTGTNEVLAPVGSTDGGRPRDAATSSTDSGSTTSDSGTRTDGGTTTSEPKEGSSRTATVYETTIHPSYEAKCMGEGDPCGFGKIAAGDAPDVALVVLDLDLEGVDSIPVDLDAVGQADPVLVIGSGCEIVGAEKGTGIFTKKTGAVPAKMVNHVGSPYKEEPAKASSLGQSYVVTAGPAWKKNEAKLCTSDFGAPMFRASVAAVAGVTSNFTTFGPDTFSPVTVQHTRVDEGGRFKIGNWLESQGAETIHSCSEMSGGCVKREYEGGSPVPPSAGPGGGTTEPGDAGKGDAIAPTGDGGKDDDDGGAGSTEPPPSGPVTGQEEQLADQGPPEQSYSDGEDDEDYADAAAPKKKKKAAEGGCSAAPGSMPAGEMGLVFGVGLAVMAIGRRRRAK
jgi:hypothetical protein